MPTKVMQRNIWPVKDEGFYLTNTSTGKSQLLASIHDLLTKADPPIQDENIKDCEIYGFHCKFNPQNTRLMLSLRWYPKREGKVRDLIWTNYSELRFTWLTMSFKDGNIHCALGPEQFLKRGHHATWFPDGNHISLNLKFDNKQMAFAMVRYDGSKLRKIVYDARGLGHPTVHPCGHILTDTYLTSWDYSQSEDGTVPLRWIDIYNGKEKVLLRIPVNQPYNDAALRIDPHPAWDRSWRYITFNGYVNQSRRVFIADMKTLITRRILDSKKINAKPTLKQIIQRNMGLIKAFTQNKISKL
ncbi:hypothetical protein GF406_09810 [candidate division KSB1 bacterium]|nr:hypothetical protein [candidate division KSB1 bacterium]